ncbi:MAG: metal-dependent hydrolase [Planctomycetes bacterium]|nr:metal-dependent hydrolase [Planctomycetota bacterium]
MDTVTHALLGAAISDTWFRKRIGPVATPFALAAAALPDIDIFYAFVSPESVWLHHRGYTHSLLPMLIASPFIGLVGYLLGRRGAAWATWTLLALVCLFSHTLLDVVTSWGTMPFLPFSNARVSWDLFPIVDAFVFSVLAASFVLNRILRWERVDHFLNPLAFPIVHKHPRRQQWSIRIAAAAMILFSLYFVIGILQNRQMVRKAGRELAAAGFDAVEIRALPHILTFISGTAVARDADGAIASGQYSTYAPGPIDFRIHPANDGPLAREALASPWGRQFYWYAQGMVEARETAPQSDASENGEGAENPANDTPTVRLLDRRFPILNNPEQTRFTMDIHFDSHGRPIAGQADSAGRPTFGDLKDELRLWWQLTWTGKMDDRAPDQSGEIVAQAE